MASWSKYKKMEESDYWFHFFVLFFHFIWTRVYFFLSPIKQRPPVCSASAFPSTLSPHPVTQPPSAPWPEVMAPSVHPFPLNDTPPPLPAKKHRRQLQQEQQVLRNWCPEFGDFTLTAKLFKWNLFFSFSKGVFKKDKDRVHTPLLFLLFRIF